MAFAGTYEGQRDAEEVGDLRGGKAAQAPQHHDVELGEGQLADGGEHLQALGQLRRLVVETVLGVQGGCVEGRVGEDGPLVAVVGLGLDGGAEDVPGVAADVGAGQGVAEGEPQDGEGLLDGGVEDGVGQEDSRRSGGSRLRPWSAGRRVRGVVRAGW